MKFFLILLLLMVAGAVTALPKPNVIFILADDLGCRDLGSFGQENLYLPYMMAIAWF
jgi:arylsulfatase A